MSSKSAAALALSSESGTVESPRLPSVVTSVSIPRAAIAVRRADLTNFGAKRGGDSLWPRSTSAGIPPPDDRFRLAEDRTQDRRSTTSRVNQVPVLRLDIVRVRLQLGVDRRQLARNVVLVLHVHEPYAFAVNRQEPDEPSGLV